MYLLTETASPFALERWAAFFANFGQFAKGFFYTLGISIGALLVALLLGLIFGAMSSTHNKVLRGISRVYVEIFQNTPLLVQFVVVFYGISILTDGHVMIPISLTAILCVGVYADTMRIIILPQAVRTILPPLTNQVVNLIKNTSTVAIISGADIMFTAKAWAYDTTNYVPAFAGAAFLYFIMCFPLATWARRKEEENKKAY